MASVIFMTWKTMTGASRRETFGRLRITCARSRTVRFDLPIDDTSVCTNAIRNLRKTILSSRLIITTTASSGCCRKLESGLRLLALCFGGSRSFRGFGIYQHMRDHGGNDDRAAEYRPTRGPLT